MSGPVAQNNLPVPPAVQRLGGGLPPRLRPYQAHAGAAVDRELDHRGVRCTLLVLPCGCGKTVCFAEHTRRWKQFGERTLIVVNRTELVNQARRKLEDVGLVADVEKGTSRASLNAKVVIASVQSLRGQRLARFARDHFTRLVIDEGHHATAPGYRALLDHFVDAKVLIVTATPDRADGQGLGIEHGGVCDTVAYRYEMRDAIRDKYLVPIVARRIVVDSVDLSTVKSGDGDFVQAQLAAVMETERAIRGVVVPLLEQARDRKTVVYGVDVEHARLLADCINELRPGAARWVSGDTDDLERERTLTGFEAGEFQFLTNCALLCEGWDCPSVSCVAMANLDKFLEELKKHGVAKLEMATKQK